MAQRKQGSGGRRRSTPKRSITQSAEYQRLKREVANYNKRISRLRTKLSEPGLAPQKITLASLNAKKMTKQDIKAQIKRLQKYKGTGLNVIDVNGTKWIKAEYEEVKSTIDKQNERRQQVQDFRDDYRGLKGRFPENDLDIRKVNQSNVRDVARQQAVTAQEETESVNLKAEWFKENYLRQLDKAEGIITGLGALTTDIKEKIDAVRSLVLSLPAETVGMAQGLIPEVDIKTLTDIPLFMANLDSVYNAWLSVSEQGISRATRRSTEGDFSFVKGSADLPSDAREFAHWVRYYAGRS